MPNKDSIEKLFVVAQDKSEMHRQIDDMDENCIAVLVMERVHDKGDTTLNIRSLQCNIPGAIMMLAGAIRYSMEKAVERLDDK